MMHQHLTRKLALAGALALVSVAMTATSAGAAVVYDNVPNPLPGNVSSLGYQANQTAEFGGELGLAGTQRQDPTVTVTMSSWGCGTSGTWNGGNCVTASGATFSHPITLNFYSVLPSGQPGGQIASVTQTFNIPFRPSASAVCGDGRWSQNGTAATCFNGFANNITFNLAGRGITLPDNVIASIAYNTTSWGANPIGTGAACFSTSQGCGYDSLNVGLTAPPSVGTLPRPDDAYWNTMTAANYCDGGTGGVGVFRLDKATASPSCNWTGLQPAFRVDANTTGGPAGPSGPAGPAGQTGAPGASGGTAGVVAGSKCKKTKKAAAAKKCKKKK
jgi:hypothetical protein